MNFIKQWGMALLFGILTVVLVIMMVSSPCIAQMPLSGEFSVMGNLDFEGEDGEIFVQHLGLISNSENTYIYGTVGDGEEFHLNEAYVKTEFQGLEWQLGKVQVPFGFMDIYNPTSSVFVEYPRENYTNYGLHLATMYDIINVEGAYVDNSDYSFKGSVNLFDGGNIFSVSYADSDSLSRYSINNEFYYSSLLFNFSNMTEWNPDNGDFWTRIVVAPGILDVVGLMGGYYNLDNMDFGLWDYDMKDSFTYGFYFDIGIDITTSVEWSSNASLSVPTIKIASTF